MSNGQSSSCSSIFESSLGFNSQGYLGNESLVHTFYPTQTAHGVQVEFFNWDLGVGDTLLIYNGVNTSAPLLGFLVGQLNGTTSFMSNPVNNPAGCLTFRFVSDAVDFGGGWVGEVSCEKWCQSFGIEFVTITPSLNTADEVGLCIGDTGIFEVGGDYYDNDSIYNQNDSSSKFYWILDGVDTIGSGTKLVYPADSVFGGYLTVVSIDTNGCYSNNGLDLITKVSTKPKFVGTGIKADTVCFGDTIDISLKAISQKWEGNEITYNTEMALPDANLNGSITHTNSINFFQFGPNDTISNSAQIENIWVDIEHSYLGNLQIKVVCPNGSGAILKSGIGGGARWLGEACHGSLNIPGNGYVYQWVPSGSVYGQMVPYSNSCISCLNVMNPCNSNLGTTLPPGTYEPAQTFSNLEGCPLNGTWTIEIKDSQVGNDGHLFSWGIEFDSLLYPNKVLAYSSGIDSVWFENSSLDTGAISSVIFQSMDSLRLLPLKDSTKYCYTLNVLDSFGCNYDTTLCFFVRDRCDSKCFSLGNTLVTKNKVICQGESTGSLIIEIDTIQIPGPWNYIWSDGNGGILKNTSTSNSSDTLQGVPAGNYQLEIIDNYGCSRYQTISLGTISPVTVNAIGITKTSCFLGGCDATASSIAFNGVAPYSYLWSNGDTLGATTNLCIGSQYVVVYDSNGCMDTANFTVLQPDPIQASVSGNSAICMGDSALLTGSAIGGNPPYSYNWGSGFGVNNIISVTPQVNTSYWLEVTDANNCPGDSVMFNVSLRPDLTVSIPSQDTFCPGNWFEVEAIASGGDGNYVFDWLGGTLGNSKLNVQATTSQFYFVTVSDGCGSIPVYDSVWVQVGGDSSLSVEVTNFDTVCMNDQYVLHAVGKNGIGQYSYEWSHSLGNGASKIVYPSQSIVYTVTVTDECLAVPTVDSVNLEIADVDSFNLLVDTSMNCAPGVFNFSWDTTNFSFAYSLDYGKGIKSAAASDTLEVKFNKIGCYDVTAEIETKQGCVSTKSYPCMVEVLPTPVANFDFSPHHPNKIENVVDFWDRSIGATSWSWYNDTLLSTSERFSSSFPNPDLYTLKLVVMNEFGCKDSTTTDMVVRDVTTYFFPSAFTPNGDGNNDEFNVVGEGIRNEDFSLIIYDSWGKIVFNGTSRDSGWNGRELNNGDFLPSGTYSYRYTLRIHTGKKYSDTGSLILIR